MAVLFAYEIASGRQAACDWLGKRTYTRRWRVGTNSALNTPLDAAIAVGVNRFDPYVGIALPNGEFSEPDLAALADEIEVEQAGGDDDPFTYLVTIKYSSRYWHDIIAYKRSLQKKESPENKQSDKSSPINPLNWPPRYEYSMTFGSRAMDIDLGGVDASGKLHVAQTLANTAGDKFASPLHLDEAYLTIIVSRNEISFDWARARDLVRRTNSKPFWGNPPNTVLLWSVSASDEMQNDFLYSKARYEFRIRNQVIPQGCYLGPAPPGLSPVFSGPDFDAGWCYVNLSEGYNELKNGVKGPPIGGGGGGDLRLVPLDINGKAMLDPNPTYVYQAFFVYRQADLNDLNIGPPP